jgi:hypothetical protein
MLVALSLYASRGSVQPVNADAAKAVAAAKAFLNTLDEKQRAKAVLDYDSSKKPSWSNLPVSAVPRNGVRMGDLTPAQHSAALGLLAAVLSKEGYQKAIDIMNGDEQLAQKGGGKGGKGGGKSSFGNDNYFMAIFGTPDATKPWMVQFGGHHLGLNITVVEKAYVLTPTHTGAQPTTFMRDGKTVRPLGAENDKAFQLVNSLDEKQLAEAKLPSQKVPNLVLGAGQDGKTIKPQGVKGTALNDSQKAKLLDLIAEWVNIVPSESATARMAEIKSKIGETYFAWYGSTMNGNPAYFRVQGPTLVIEYAPQGGTDHIHTIVRDPTNDYGVKLVKK